MIQSLPRSDIPASDASMYPYIDISFRYRYVVSHCMEERRNRADLVELFMMYKGLTAIHFESLFTLDCNNKGTRGHLAKRSKPRCQKDVRKYFFSHRVIDRWNALDGEAVSSSSINALKNRLNKIRMTRMGYFMD